MKKFRIEKDSLGEVKVPVEAYYGAQTMRAVKNFPISGVRESFVLVDSYVFIKKAAALTNMQLKLLDKKKGNAIVKASNEILSGKLREQFVVDIFQAGAGTSFNMNVNEVIANRAIEILKSKRGDTKIIHPNDHVNMSQSTNDTFPTAMLLASLFEMNKLLPVIKHFENTLSGKSKEFSNVIKSGRTHLIDASPITLGQEFSGYTEIVRKHYSSIKNTSKHLSELGIGGTAVGTGLNSHINYKKLILKNLRNLTKLKLSSSPNPFEAMQSMLPFMELSSAIRNFAVDMTKICNDLRLLGSGPNTGLREIILPAVQPGSSIMPGKINPSMAEMMNMVCFQVIGNDTTVTFASQAGQLELNVMMPVIIYNILFSLEILRNALKVFDEYCVSGIKADKNRTRKYAENSISIVTALNPIIGYSKAAEIAKEAVAKEKSIIEIIKERKILNEEQLNKLLDLMKLTKPGL